MPCVHVFCSYIPSLTRIEGHRFTNELKILTFVLLDIDSNFHTVFESGCHSAVRGIFRRTLSLCYHKSCALPRVPQIENGLLDVTLTLITFFLFVFILRTIYVYYITICSNLSSCRTDYVSKYIYVSSALLILATWLYSSYVMA